MAAADVVVAEHLVAEQVFLVGAQPVVLVVVRRLWQQLPQLMMLHRYCRLQMQHPQPEHAADVAAHR